MVLFIVLTTILVCIMVILIMLGIGYLIRVHKAKMFVLSYELLKIYNEHNPENELEYKNEVFKEIEDILSKGI
ncbi:hypothetical protein HMPREF9723_02170 [Treponema denticola OTK]|uniref:Uncharacterized protein n=1 Tax=Treponema denticola OTK TaxID=999434 RepID=A0A0F6MNS8_TREDN|nr:hypothetical protein [Treponema denticola]EMB20710.1 hypothetical protein HMPREF9723_02170 [Treponema denticola OTK]DAK62935.1 MAG TPA: hypothetical protein [Caudoviricetes sp.]